MHILIYIIPEQNTVEKKQQNKLQYFDSIARLMLLIKI